MLFYENTKIFNVSFNTILIVCGITKQSEYYSHLHTMCNTAKDSQPFSISKTGVDGKPWQSQGGMRK